MLNKKYYFKLILVLVLAYMLSNALSTSVFLARTPRINQRFISELFNTPGKMVASLIQNNSSKKVDRQKQNQVVDQMKQLPASALNTVAPGIYAKEDDTNDIIYIRITKDAEWDEQIVNVDGKEMKLRFPKGTIK